MPTVMSAWTVMEAENSLSEAILTTDQIANEVITNMTTTMVAIITTNQDNPEKTGICSLYFKVDP